MKIFEGLTPLHNAKVATFGRPNVAGGRRHVSPAPRPGDCVGFWQRQQHEGVGSIVRPTEWSQRQWLAEITSRNTRCTVSNVVNAHIISDEFILAKPMVSSGVSESASAIERPARVSQNDLVAASPAARSDSLGPNAGKSANHTVRTFVVSMVE